VNRAVIVGDVQAPLQDSRAWDVAMQIVEDLKPTHASANGDWVEFRHLSMRYPALKGDQGKQLGATAAEEAATAKGLLSEFGKACGPKCKKFFNAGNHEWRLFRALSNIPQILEIMNLPKVAEALCVEAVFGLKELGFRYSGEYPAGHWLFDLQPHRNVYVHHGYMVRQKAGYQASAETDKRMVSTVTGHGERMGVVWRRDITDRRIFSVEGGNLSRLGEPGIGAGIYTSCPFNQPEYLDRQQGLTVIYQDGDQISPVCIPIHHGKAIFQGKLYKS
jgi:hypothetical protein